MPVPISNTRFPSWTSSKVSMRAIRLGRVEELVDCHRSGVPGVNAYWVTSDLSLYTSLSHR